MDFEFILWKMKLNGLLFFYMEWCMFGYLCKMVGSLLKIWEFYYKILNRWLFFLLKLCKNRLMKLLVWLIVYKCIEKFIGVDVIFVIKLFLMILLLL